MKKRHPLAVAALTLVTFGVYAYYWLYATTDELRRETGRRELSPLLDVLLALITLGLWGVWAGYRNARIAHEELEARGEKHSDRSLVIGAFAAVGAFSGWAWPVAIALLQEDLNRMVEPTLDYHERVVHRAAAVRPRVRVELEQPAPAYAPEAVAPASRWESAPSAPVFISNAPMPIVY